LITTYEAPYFVIVGYAKRINKALEKFLKRNSSVAQNTTGIAVGMKKA